MPPTLSTHALPPPPAFHVRTHLTWTISCSVLQVLKLIFPHCLDLILSTLSVVKMAIDSIVIEIQKRVPLQYALLRCDLIYQQIRNPLPKERIRVGLGPLNQFPIRGTDRALKKSITAPTHVS